MHPSGRAAALAPPCRWSRLGSSQVHFIEKEKGRDVVPAQQLPQGLRMSLDAVGAADDQNGVVQHLKGALHLRREIHMSRGVQKGESQGPQLAAPACLEKMVMPRARSRLWVSRKASW